MVSISSFICRLFTTAVKTPSGRKNSRPALATSHWFADQGQTDEAVCHALATNVDELAITLVEQSAMWLVEHSFMGTLLNLVDKLPKEKIKKRCELQLAIAWANCLTHHQQAAQEALDCVARALVREDHRIASK